MLAEDRIRELNSIFADDADAIDRTSQPFADGSLTVLAKTATDGSYPTVASRVYKMAVQTTTVNETENSTATFAADGSITIYAFNLGSTVPTNGSGPYICTTGPDGRWYFST